MRKAFLIGNADYVTETKLPCCTNDASRIREKLKRLGFKNYIEDSSLDNMTRQDMQRDIARFVADLHHSDIVFFYFSGHGCHDENGNNFILPVDYKRDMEFRSEEFCCGNKVVRALEEKITTGFCVIFYDACRRVKRKGGSVGEIDGLKIGMTDMQARGTIIGYSCEEGQYSYAGEQISPYTDSLVKNLVSNKDIALIFRAVNNDLSLRALNRLIDVQKPRYLDSLASGSEVYLSNKPRLVPGTTAKSIPIIPGLAVYLSNKAQSVSSAIAMIIRTTCKPWVLVMLFILCMSTFTILAIRNPSEVPSQIFILFMTIILIPVYFSWARE